MHRSLRNAIPTLAFASVTACVLLVDFYLVKLLKAILKYGDFGIHFEGMGTELNLGELFGDQSGKNILKSLRVEGM